MTYSLTEIRTPPQTLNFEGKPRRVGVEVEFAALSARTVAQEIRSTFGGKIIEKNPHRLIVQGTEFGEFVSELDTQYAHPIERESSAAEDPVTASFLDIIDALREFYGDISSLIVPCEIISPPLELAQLPKFDAFIRRLSTAGAEGTGSSPFYAFGTHLNPDIASTDARGIVAVLKAQMLLSGWLREVMSIDLTRRLTAFADAFPDDYVRQVVAPDYWPDMDVLISDYLASNPTRDRELDMLPLFAWLDEAAVRGAVGSSKISKRPTFHYRLPNANLGVEGWSIGLEWNRWCVVERLAADTDRLNAMGEAYIHHQQRLLPERWSVRASEWLIL